MISQREKLGFKVYDILVKMGGASIKMRASFLAWWMSENTSEFRFQGLLGFGGKFWKNDNRWYVSCYPEDETTERLNIISKTNTLLGDLKKTQKLCEVE